MAEEKKFSGTVLERIRILANAKFDFIFAAVSAFGAALITFLFSVHDIQRWIPGVTTFAWLLILFVLIFIRAERDEARSAAGAEILKRKELDEKIKTEKRDEAINLTDLTANYASRTLRYITGELRLTSTLRSSLDTETRISDHFAALKNRILRQICRDIRSVFEGDPRGVDTTTWPHNFFKIALFEPEPNPENAQILRRTFFDYPEGIEPSPKTEIFNIREDARATVVLAFVNQNIVIIEDIKTENTKPIDVKRWINKRDNQADDYESMVCVSIVSGIKGQPDRKCLGVLVIDTNRERYFREDRSFQAFLGNLLNPFRTILTFSLELRIYFC